MKCIAEKKGHKEECGYVMLDLRSAKQKGLPQEPVWYPVLNSGYSKKKQLPELQVCLIIEEQEVKAAYSRSTISTVTAVGGSSDLKLQLHSDGEYYTLGPTTAPDARIYLYSIMLLNPLNLPPLLESGTSYHFYFDLLGHRMSSETFNPPVFRSEQSAIRVKTTETLLLKLLRNQRKFIVCLCCGNQVVGKGYVPIHSLGINESATCTLILGVGNASVEVGVSIGECVEKSMGRPSSDSVGSKEKGRRSTSVKSSSSRQSTRSAKRNLSQNFEEASTAASFVDSTDQDKRGSNYTIGRHPSSQSWQQCHPGPISSSSSSGFSLHHPANMNKGRPVTPTKTSRGPTLESHDTRGRELSISPEMQCEDQVHRHSFPSASSPPFLSSPKHYHHHHMCSSSDPEELDPPVGVLMSQQVHSGRRDTSAHSSFHRRSPSPLFSSHQFAPGDHPDVFHAHSSSHHSIPSKSGPVNRSGSKSPANQLGPTTSIEKRSVPLRGSGSVPETTDSTKEAHFDSTVGLGGGGGHEEIYFSEAVWFSASGQIKDCRHFRFSLDMRSLQDLSLEVGTSYYLRYSYGFFGCPYPVLIQPPVPLVFPGANLSFLQSFCSFDFAVQHDNLIEHLSKHPLTVEVWSSCPKKRDFVAGIAQVPLHEVLSQDKICCNDGSTRQMVTLQCQVYSPCSSFLSNTSTNTGQPTKPSTTTPSLASLNITMVMEDLGALTKEKAKSGEVSQFTAKKKSRQMDNDLQMMVNVHTKAPAIAEGGTDNNKEGGVASGGPEGGMSGDALGAAKNSGGSGNFMEYQAAMELEMWKASEEEAFQEYLKGLEASHMNKLGEEWKKRETERHELFKKKLDQYTMLEKRLVEGLQKLQLHQQNVSAKEKKVDQDKMKLKQERDSLGKIHAAEMKAAQTNFEHQIAMERRKASDLQEQLEATKKKMREELKSREEEVKKSRSALPPSKLVADLEILKLEKEELQRKVTVLGSAKEQYKNKWKEALTELARYHRQEQHLTQKRLLAQEKELEELRRDIVKMDEQNNLNLHISSVKDEAERIQKHILSQRAAEGSPGYSRSHSGHCHHSSRSPSNCHHHRSASPSSPSVSRHSPSSEHRDKHAHTHSDSCEAKKHDSPSSNLPVSLTTDVARWIEEREILLQTGVYSDTDVTIQALDAKIRGAMLKINSE